MTQEMQESVQEPVMQQDQMAPQAPEEKMLPQSQVNELVGRAKREAVESYKRQQQAAPESKYGLNNPAAFADESTVRRLAAEEFERRRDEAVAKERERHQQAEAERIVQNFHSKVGQGKDKYDDFEKVTGDLELANFPNVVQLLADHVDNSHDVLYELGKDRMKMAQLEQLSRMSPKDAIRQAQRLATSIKENEEAQKIKTPNAPLAQQRPSNVGTDTGALSVRDYRNKYKV